ncbi:hypothetical protein EVAR_45316_1 [Eumeta japonica]|uniref:Uncharacterized protein n=1 Tax=Eumeta variegata TaxID=151549 RepID=A0A4C1XLE0_EUMVA|nr:hypothetical protein EVAR_45316_1 [Eumeta japonica]
MKSNSKRKLSTNTKITNDDMKSVITNDVGVNDTNGDEVIGNGDAMINGDRNDESPKLHGYDRTSHGCGDVGEKIQLENPDKKEPLVCIYLVGGKAFGEGAGFWWWIYCLVMG